MARELKTAEEIQAEVSRLIHEIREVKEDNAKVRVPVPTETTPDPSGCNWTMLTFGGDAASYMHGIFLSMIDVQRRWNLKT